MNKRNNKLDPNDVAFIQERHEVVAGIPAPWSKGRPHFHVSRFVLSDGRTTDVFHSKPVYYEHRDGSMRPLAEVTSHHGNKKIVLNDKWADMHPRYLNWLIERQRLIGGTLNIPSTWMRYAHSSVHNLLTGHVGLTVQDYFPNPNVETVSVDGECAVYYVGGTDLYTWAGLEAITTATYTDDAAASSYCAGVASDTSTDKWRFIWGGMFLFDTSPIGDSDTIDAATFYIYGNTKANDGTTYDSTNCKVNIYTCNPASNTGLVHADYSTYGTTAQCDTGISYTDFSTTGYNSYALNATGLGNVSKTGCSKFATRETNYTVGSTTPPWSSNKSLFFQVYYAEQADTTSDPKLTVTYTAGGASGPANLKSYDTNLKANIKSYNTNLIANIKSMNTNV